MSKLARIHTGKQPFRRHFLKEWLDVRGMGPMDLLNALNEAASMDTPLIDKSQVYRWMKGQLPHPPTQIRIAAALELVDPETGDPDPERLQHHPDSDWFIRITHGRPREDIERIKQMIELAMPKRTGGMS